MKLIYIGHPLVGDGSPEWGDMERNVERYLQFAAMVTNQGDVVVSWVHHFLMHDRGLTRGDAHFYLSRDRELLRVSHELWVCGPPETSSGLQYEIDCAREFDIPIIQLDEWMDPSFMPVLS